MPKVPQDDHSTDFNERHLYPQGGTVGFSQQVPPDNRLPSFFIQNITLLGFAELLDWVALSAA